MSSKNCFLSKCCPECSTPESTTNGIFFHVASIKKSKTKQKTQEEIKLYSIVDVHIRAILLQESENPTHTNTHTYACMSTHIHTENYLVILLAVKHSCATNVTYHKHAAFLKLGSKMSG